jgi:RHS repeat-associated protein
MPIALVADVDTSPTLYFVHTDHLDRPIMMTDVNKSIVWQADYNPFGGVYSITGSATNNLRFPGQYFLMEDGLHYNWYRHYDPTIGRYIQPDPLRDVIATSVATTTNFDTSLLFPTSTASNDTEAGNAATLPVSATNAIAAELPDFKDGASVYSYAKSSPIMHVDRRGLVASGPYTPVPKVPATCVASKHDDCVAQCLHLLPSPSGDLQSSEFRKCYRECMGTLS